MNLLGAVLLLLTPERAIQQAEVTFDIPENLLYSICYIESNHNPHVVTPADGGQHTSVGLCQIQDRTAKEMGFTGASKDLLHVGENSMYAAKYLRFQLDRYGNIPDAVASYNRGSVLKVRGKYSNQEYVDKVYKQWRITMNLKLMNPEERDRKLEELNKNPELGKPVGVKSKSNVSSKTYIPPTLEERIKQYDESVAARMEAIANGFPFIEPDFYKDFTLTSGLTVIGAMSGTCKTTTAANLLMGFIKYASSDKVAKVVLNEEQAETMLNRIACGLINLPFIDFYKAKLTKVENLRVKEKAIEIMPRVDIVGNSGTCNGTILEDVQAAMNHAAITSNTGLVMLDYYQNVIHADVVEDQFKVLKILGAYLKDYSQQMKKLPVVVFVQLRGATKSDFLFQSRVEGDRTFYNHAQTAIEVIPDRETNVTTFKFQKDRFFNLKGMETTMHYKDGVYVTEV